MAGLFDTVGNLIFGEPGGIFEPELEKMRRNEAIRRSMRTLGGDLQALALGVRPPPLEREPSELERLSAQELRNRARREQAAQAQAAATRRRALGPYHTAAGGVPWVNPDTGQAVTGGIFDELAQTPEQRALLEAPLFGLDYPSVIYERAFPEPAEAQPLTTTNTVEVKGPDGQPIRVPISQAVAQGLQLWKKPPKPDVLSPEALAQQIDLRRAGKPTTDITLNTAAKLPKPQAGWMYRSDPQTGLPMLDEEGRPSLIPIPGGPADIERLQAEEDREAAQATAAEAERRRLTQAGIVAEDIQRALELSDETILGLPTTTGFLGQTLQSVGGTAANDLRAKLDTIRANVGFEQLQKMREASPTGGALGQVSERENVLLQSVLGSLDQSQTDDEIKFNLLRLQEVFLDIIHGPGNRPYGPGGATPQLSPVQKPVTDMTDEEIWQQLLQQEAE